MIWPCGERGSVTVEASACALVLSLLVPGVLATSYSVFAQIWVERQAYEALICLASRSEVRDCDRDFRARVSRALIFGETSRLQLHRNGRGVEINTRFKLGKFDLVHVHNKKSLPLVKAERFL